MQKAGRKIFSLFLVWARPLTRVIAPSLASCALQGHMDIGGDPEKKQQKRSEEWLSVAIKTGEKELTIK